MSEARDDRPRQPCPACGEAILAEARKCRYCGHVLDPALAAEERRASRAADPGMDWVAPVRVPGMAVAAGYLGLLSLTCWLAPFALVFGILALRQVRRNGDSVGSGRAWFGIVMGAIGTAVLVLSMVVLLANLGQRDRF